MQYQEFVDRVRQRTTQDDERSAEILTEVTLATLGERLYRTERDHLAAQLPAELRAFLTERSKPETTRMQTEGFTIQEFYNRVSERANLDYQTSKDWSQAVIDVLKQAVTPGTIEEVRDSLPAEFGGLFQ